MYVRDAKNREEVWLLDHIEEMGLDETAFRSRDYVVAIDDENHEKAGFGRIRFHKPDEGDDVCELTSIGVLEEWRDQGVGAHVVERLIEYASDDGFDTIYSLTDQADYLQQFGFERIETSTLPEKLADHLDEKRETLTADVVPMRIDTDSFGMPSEYRQRFKDATPGADEEETEPVEGPEDFGIDPDKATYKYDTGG